MSASLIIHRTTASLGVLLALMVAACSGSDPRSEPEIDGRGEVAAVSNADTGGPAIDVWAGDTQQVGQPGVSQRWINILGNVSDPDGIGDLTFQLNGGIVNGLSTGPDTRRLLNPGDFVVEIDYADLEAGGNEVLISAVDGLGNVSSKVVTLNYSPGNVWPFDYAIDWSQVNQIEEVADIVDGRWLLSSDGVEPEFLGYDRTFVVGDLTWTDCEVTVPITIYGIDPGGFQWPSVAPGIGFYSRWRGHTTLQSGEQPHAFWRPHGGAVWYDFEFGRQVLSGDEGLYQHTPRVLDYGVTYYWKLRTEGQPDGRTFYGLKVWEQGQAEPADWDLSGIDGPTDTRSGSLIFIAHHVDATFGNIDVVDLGSDLTPPTISAIQHTQDSDSADVEWLTDEYSLGGVRFGETPSFELWQADELAFSEEHIVTLDDLVPGTTYYYEVFSTDARGNSAADGPYSFEFVGVPDPPTGPESDDFSASSLDTSLWTFVDPRGDGAVSMNGTQVEITAPAGGDHDVWIGDNGLPRIRQAVSDADFEVEVKFESDLELVQGFQSQGILIEQDDLNVLRFEFHTYQGNERVFAASIFGNNASIKAMNNVSLGNPMHLKVARSGNSWTMSYSFNGADWIQVTSFNHAMTATGVSVYAGSGETESHTAIVDYFFNTASPISPEDGGTPPAPLVVDAVSLLGGTVGQTYAAQTLTASGGVPPYSWSVSLGTLPPGLSLSAAGVISGVPQTVGIYDFTVMATDAASTGATLDLSIIVNTDTCEASCGGQSPAGCWCDDQCSQFGDCCPDYEQRCTPPQTCEGSCGGQSPTGCWCDDQCSQFGDCCPDFAEWCTEP